MHWWARGLCLVALLAGCGEDAEPQWSSCEEARAATTYFEVPSVEFADPIEVGDELPVLRWGAAVSDAERLATQALSLACVLSHNEITARPALLEWAQAYVDGDEQQPTGVFDRNVGVFVTRLEPGATLSASRDVSAEPELDEATAEARAIELVESLLVEGVMANELSRLYLNSTVVGRDGTHETTTRLAAVAWLPRVGRAHVGLSSVEAHVDSNGHVSRLSVPLGRVFDDGDRVLAAVAESEAEGLFLEKAEASLGLEGWTLENPTGLISVPVLDAGEVTELMWVGSYVPTSDDGQVGRRTPYYMLLSDADAPLFRP